MDKGLVKRVRYLRRVRRMRSPSEENYTRSFLLAHLPVVSARLLVQSGEEKNLQVQNITIVVGDKRHYHSHLPTHTDCHCPFAPVTVSVSSEKQQLIGVKVATVEKAPWTPTLRVLGRVAPDENRIYRIISATDGWVKKILPVTTGSLVKEDELLATFFSPEFFSGIKAYLFGLRSLDRFEASRKETKEQIEQTGANIENYRNALRNLGMTEHQLDEIMRTRQGADNIEVRAPAAGFILARNLSPGQRFEKGTELFRIADLSKVWILADMFENEAQYLPHGKSAKVSLPHQKKIFQAKVSSVLPQSMRPRVP
jgi:Cu(I)/Ag(I) efflux system membrane fusion protein